MTINEFVEILLKCDHDSNVNFMCPEYSAMSTFELSEVIVEKSLISGTNSTTIVIEE